MTHITLQLMNVAEKLANTNNAELLGFTHLGSGTYRNVFTHSDFPDVVFKRGRHGENCANISEHKIWKDATKKQRTILAGVLYISSCGLVNVMEKVAKVAKTMMTVDNVSYDEVEQIMRMPICRAIDDLWPTGGCPFSWDIHIGNYGLMPDDRPVMIDYQHGNTGW